MRDMFEGDDDLLRRYLLGELSEPEEEGLEQRLLHDDQLFEQTEAAADDLLEEYLRRELTATQRRSIRNRWAATPGGQLRLALVRDLRKIADQHEPVPKPELEREPAFRMWPRVWQTWVPAAAAAALLAVAGLVYFELGPKAADEKTHIVDIGVAAKPLHGASTPIPAPHPTPSPTPAAGTPRTETPATTPRTPAVTAPTPPLVAAFTLAFTSATRGGPEETPVAKVPERAQVLEPRVSLDLIEYPAYEVAISRADTGKQVFQQHGLRPAGDALVFRMPADRMPPGTYTITVRGIQENGETDPLAVLSDRAFELQKK